jgi:hypothetical protein
VIRLCSVDRPVVARFPSAPVFVERHRGGPKGIGYFARPRSSTTGLPRWRRPWRSRRRLLVEQADEADQPDGLGQGEEPCKHGADTCKLATDRTGRRTPAVPANHRVYKALRQSGKACPGASTNPTDRKVMCDRDLMAPLSDPPETAPGASSKAPGGPANASAHGEFLPAPYASGAVPDGFG